MHRVRPSPVTGLAAVLAAGALLAWWSWPDARPVAGPEPVLASPDQNARAGSLRREGMDLLAAGEFPHACERFARAADQDPASDVAWHAVARCFEGWGWRALRRGHIDEARVLFAQGLRAVPGEPALLRGLGVAAIHDGHHGEALALLERAAEGAADPELRLLLARLWERWDNAERAALHLRAVLERAPEHELARQLLDKVERERAAEAGFRRVASPGFIIKYGPARQAATARSVLRALEAAADRVSAALGARAPEPLTVALYDDAKFRDVTGLHGGASGLFDGKIRLPLRVVTDPRPALDRVVAHEYAHAAIHHLSRGRAPRWLHEGLAQVLEGVEAEPRAPVRAWLTLTRLEALVTDRDPVRASVGYEIAARVVGDLVRRGSMASMRALLARLGAGDSMAVALTRIYGFRQAELESEWRHLLGA